MPIGKNIRGDTLLTTQGNGMSKKIETIIVTIHQGKPGGDPIIGRVKNSDASTGKVVFFKDLAEVELPDVGDEVEAFVINEFEKVMYCVFHEDTAQKFLMPKNKSSYPKSEIKETPQPIGEIIHEQVEKTNKTLFNKKTIYELTCVDEVNDFLSDRTFVLINTHVVDNKIVYVVHRAL